MMAELPQDRAPAVAPRAKKTPKNRLNPFNNRSSGEVGPKPAPALNKADLFWHTHALAAATSCPALVQAALPYQPAPTSPEVFQHTLMTRTCAALPHALVQAWPPAFKLPRPPTYVHMCRVDNGKLYAYMNPGATEITNTWRLPAGVSCANGCIMQWWWTG
jgi:hypothetical protein